MKKTTKIEISQIKMFLTKGGDFARRDPYVDPPAPYLFVEYFYQVSVMLCIEKGPGETNF